MHQSLLNVTCPEMNMSRYFFFFFLPQSLREVEVSSTSCNGEFNKNVARTLHYIRQRFVQLVSQRRKGSARQVGRKTA